VVFQPLIGGALAAGGGHAPDQRPERRGRLCGAEPQLFELALQPKLPDRLQRHLLDAGAARTHDVDTGDIHRLIVRRRRCGLLTRAGMDDMGRVALRQRLLARRQRRHRERLLRTDQLLDALRQQRPPRARHLKVPPQVQQRVLTHPIGGAHRLHQAIGVIGLPATPALDRGATNVHSATVASLQGKSNRARYDYGTTFCLCRYRPRKLNVLPRPMGQKPPNITGPKSNLGYDSWSEKREDAAVCADAGSALSQTRPGAYLIASSKEIRDDDSDPPCIRAMREYEAIAKEAKGRFMRVTGPKPTHFTVTRDGPKPETHLSGAPAIIGGGAIGRAALPHG
jgi:hypothetical protein